MISFWRAVSKHNALALPFVLKKISQKPIQCSHNSNKQNERK